MTCHPWTFIKWVLRFFAIHFIDKRLHVLNSFKVTELFRNFRPFFFWAEKIWAWDWWMLSFKVKSRGLDDFFMMGCWIDNQRVREVIMNFPMIWLLIWGFWRYNEGWGKSGFERVCKIILNGIKVDFHCSKCFYLMEMCAWVLWSRCKLFYLA